MEKIIFNNGTQPYINDTNLNQMQDNAENAINVVDDKVDALTDKVNERKYIVATTTETSLDSSKHVKLNSIVISEGDCFSLSNNGILIGEGVSKVEVSANTFIEGELTANRYVWSQVRKNNTNVNGTISPYVGGGFISSPIPNKIIEVSEGDILYLYVDNTAGGSFRLGNSNVFIQVKFFE